MNMLAIFPELMTAIQVYRKPDKSNSFDDQSYALNGTISGYMQRQSGSYTQVNSADGHIFSDTLYTTVGVDVKTNDRILYNGNYYQVGSYQSNGISGVNDHQEIPADHINDL